MRLDVYPTDGEAFEAAAERVAAILADGGREAPTVALSGGRSGRGVMLALGARTDLPWERIEWFWGDERCVPADDPRRNVRLARDTLLGPRGVRAERIHPPPVELGEPERIAAAYAETLRERLGPGAAPVFDLVLLGMGADGHVASLVPGSAALHVATAVAAVPAAEVSTEPRVARVTITPSVLRAARRVLVTVTGDDKAAVVARALRDPTDPDRLPARLVLPGATVDWIVDRAAAAALLAGARQADTEPQ
jgi:6-phosphogluconolactonase